MAQVWWMLVARNRNGAVAWETPTHDARRIGRRRHEALDRRQIPPIVHP